jgi:TrpR family trp operon transcriptional repressor
MNINDPRVEEYLNDLAQTFANINDPELITSFLRSLLTPPEIADIAARWALVKALHDKVPQREIAKRFGLSLCKITRGSRELKKPDSTFIKILAKAEST